MPAARLPVMIGGMRRRFRVVAGLAGGDAHHAEVAVCVARMALKRLGEAYRQARVATDKHACTSAYRVLDDAALYIGRAQGNYRSVDEPDKGKAAKILNARRFACQPDEASKWEPPKAQGLKMIAALDRMNLRARAEVLACARRAAGGAVTETL